MRGQLPISPDEWKVRVVHPCNELFWSYVEILESSVTELFQQLTQIPLEKWNVELFQAVADIKVLLLRHIEDATWVLKRLDKLFWEYKWSWELQNGEYFIWIKKIANHWNTQVDNELETNLEKSRKFLTFNFKKFANRYREYLKLKLEAEQSAEKFNHYPVYNYLEQDTRSQLRSTYLLVKIWQLNNTTKGLPVDLLSRTLTNAIQFPSTYDNIKTYIKKLENAVIGQSRLLKSLPPEALLDENGISKNQELINSYKAEVRTLWVLISRYREFLLLTDPNPYVRTRWGFSEWTVGPEPVRSKQLMDFEFSTERLNRLIEKLLEAVGKGAHHTVKVSDIKGDVQRWLHEMSQPLISKSMMRVNAERIVDTIQDFNELGSFEKEAVPFVGDTLSRALRADWKYHVLFDISAFNEIYRIHTEIVGEPHDRQHISRLNLFRKLIQQLNSWIQARTLNKHAYEIEQDMNDIKEGLQEFYAWVQKTFSREDLSGAAAVQLKREVAEMLLEYRYIFGQFFHDLRENEPEERSIRNRFLFVDQYFESVDSKLQEFNP
jgi:hypothetical protein